MGIEPQGDTWEHAENAEEDGRGYSVCVAAAYGHECIYGVQCDSVRSEIGQSSYQNLAVLRNWIRSPLVLDWSIINCISNMRFIFTGLGLSC